MTRDIFHNVIDQNLCIGCGACAAVQREALRMTWSDDGFFLPVRKEGFKDDLDPSTLNVCPFNDDTQNEDWISEKLYAIEGDEERDNYIGYSKKCFLGYCRDSRIRENATSGGIIAWTIRHCLSEGKVDRVLAVGDAEEDDRLFAFRCYRSLDELDAPLKSRYYPSEFSKVLQNVIDTPGTVLFVGLPCQVKALRKIALLLPEIRKKLKYTASLFCGHLKSRHYAEYLAMHAEVDPESVESIDFRKKRKDANASAYGYEVTYRDGTELRKAGGVTRDVFASSWSNNLFMNPACEFCDDVVGETADLSVGDAWLPGYTGDWRGTSVVVIRNPELVTAIKHAEENGELRLEETTPDVVYQSQSGGFRQRRDALQYRLALAAKEGRIIPKKRVAPSIKGIGFLDRYQQRLRIRLREKSNRAFRRSESHRDLATFRHKIGFMRWMSDMIVLVRRIQRKARGLCRKLFRTS
jgi:coenzyme F420 hydrogenase subunit beta